MPQGAALRLTADAGEALAIGVLPTTRWEDITPGRSYLDELATNAEIRRVCPHVAQIASDIRAKAEELPFEDEAEALVNAISNEDGLFSIVAYTHDLQQPGGVKEGNYYFEMNRKLRDRSPAGRAELMMTWGVCVHYTLKALAKLNDFHGIVYRGFPATDKEGILQKYKKGRPIQWGAFTSTTTSLQAASGFAGAGGVIIKIDVQSGRNINPLSFFPTEGEILLSPNHKFVVTSENGGYTEGGRTFIDMLETMGTWLVS